MKHQILKREIPRSIIYFVVILMLLVVFLGIRNFIKPPLSKDKVDTIALSAARKYCGANDYGSDWCDAIRLDHVEGPLDYGPTDGKDEYYGNWLYTYISSADVHKQVFVVLNFDGMVLYVNSTGKEEYPYA